VGVSLGQVSDFGTASEGLGDLSEFASGIRIEEILHRADVTQQQNLSRWNEFPPRTYDCLPLTAGLTHSSRNPYRWHPASERTR